MTTDRSTSDSVNLKQEALNFFSMNSHVIKSVEQGINGIFYENPYDIFGYLVKEFNKKLKITI